jgi:hypothetical protein
MKIALSTIFVFFCLQWTFAQYEYEPNEENPFGKYNPEAPKQVQDFEGLIGE